MRQGGRMQQSALEHLAHTARVLTRPSNRTQRPGNSFPGISNCSCSGIEPRTSRASTRLARSCGDLFEDSLLFLPLLPDRPLRVVDIGAGAGIPGMPLRIVDERIEVTLIESKRKRVSFLKTLRRELGLEKSVVVEEGRAEALVSEVVRRDGAFDVAVARAVGNLEASGSDSPAVSEARGRLHRLGAAACSVGRFGGGIARGMARSWTTLTLA